MCVLLVHNYYGSTAPSGENQVFEAEKTMLEGHGVTVDVFTRHSDEIRGTKVKEEGEGGRWTCRFLSRVQKLYGLIKGAVCTVANPFAAWALKKKIREFSPDVVHFHNTFPLISPLAIRTAKKSGVKVVMTLHNYRMVCAAGVPMRCGKVCRECFLDRVWGKRPRRDDPLGAAQCKVADWLSGVTRKSFCLSLEKLVSEKEGRGEYRFKTPSDREEALKGACQFFDLYSRNIIEMSDGRCVYFSPDLRSLARCADRSSCWAEYAFHAVSSSGAFVEGKPYRERWYNADKARSIPLIESIIRSEVCGAMLVDKQRERDSAVFLGTLDNGRRLEVVTRVDWGSEGIHNLMEVTVLIKNARKNPPPRKPLAEVVEAVERHQGAGYLPSTDGNMIANVANERKRARLSVRPAIRHRCYRNSLLATAPLALNIWLYRKCWAKWVDRFIVLSEFQRQIMIECGLAAEKIVVKGNFIQSNNLNNPNNRTMRSGFVFVGRLSDEKGLRTLIAAWRLLGAEAPNLTVIGDGDSRVTYETLATGLNIKYVGKKSHEEVMDVFSRARFIIQPSLCWETFGLTIVEAAACGAPAIVSDVGTLPELVKDGVSGVVFKVGDAEDLARVVREMRNTHDWGEMSSAARTESKRYSESNNYSVLMDLYLSLKEPEGRGC